MLAEGRINDPPYCLPGDFSCRYFQAASVITLIGGRFRHESAAALVDVAPDRARSARKGNESDSAWVLSDANVDYFVGAVVLGSGAVGYFGSSLFLRSGKVVYFGGTLVLGSGKVVFFGTTLFLGRSKVVYLAVFLVLGGGKVVFFGSALVLGSGKVAYFGSALMLGSGEKAMDSRIRGSDGGWNPDARVGLKPDLRHLHSYAGGVATRPRASVPFPQVLVA